MSFGKIGVAEEKDVLPLWREYGDQFPITQSYVYLNHAAVSPLSRRAAEAMKLLADEVLLHGANHYERWMQTYEAVRVAAAKILGAHRDEIALVKNTSEGIATVALGIDWRPGDRVVGFREEFPSNRTPWAQLEARGVRVDWLSVEDPLDRIDEACRGARVLAISHVNYVSGYRVDLVRLGEIARRRGCFFFVDAIQGMGAYPIDVEAAQIDALAADGHKWLIGPEGCGVLYMRRDRLDEVAPSEYGWSNTAGYEQFGSDGAKLRADAGRYEPGTLNTIGCYGLRAALELVLEVGVERIATAVDALAARIAEGVQERGYELAVRRTAETGSGIVSFRKAGSEARYVVKKLRDVGVLAAQRHGWVRAAPHYYVSPEGVERLLGELG